MNKTVVCVNPAGNQELQVYDLLSQNHGCYFYVVGASKEQLAELDVYGRVNRELNNHYDIKPYTDDEYLREFEGVLTELEIEYDYLSESFSVVSPLD